MQVLFPLKKCSNNTCDVPVLLNLAKYEIEMFFLLIETLVNILAELLKLPLDLQKTPSK